MKKEIMQFLFGKRYKEQPAAFWKEFWGMKATEVFDVFVLTAFACIAYFILFWIPSVVFFQDEPNAPKIGILTTVITNEAGLPIFNPEKVSVERDHELQTWLAKGNSMKSSREWDNYPGSSEAAYQRFLSEYIVGYKIFYTTTNISLYQFNDLPTWEGGYEQTSWFGRHLWVLLFYVCLAIVLGCILAGVKEWFTNNYNTLTGLKSKRKKS